MMSKTYSTAEVADRAGVHRDTLLRWLRAGLVPEPGRDRRGWRVFSDAEADRIARFASIEGVSPLFLSQGSAPSKQVDSAAEPLRNIDWDFINSKTSYLTHGLHPYPAKFIPQIPNALIQELSSIGDTVCDIFCGSGTTLVEALVLKRHAIGIDANPLACLISRAKTTPISDADAKQLLSLADFSEAQAAKQSSHQTSLFSDSATALPELMFPDDIAFWFEDFISDELRSILSYLRPLTTAQRQLAHAAFSSIVVAVSKQDSDTRYVRARKSLSPGDALLRFARSLRSAVAAVLEMTDVVEQRFTSMVVHSDILAKPDVPKVDLVVCSPPYPNAWSYHLYHRTRMLWLGLDDQKFKTCEIGSHRKYSSKVAGAPDARTFESEMYSVFSWLRAILKPNKFACFVIGDSIIRGEVIDNAELLSRAARRAGFIETCRIARTLQDTRKSFNPKIGKIRTETILVVRNG